MAENDQRENQTEETVTMSKSDYDKSIQSAEDKLRTKYSKEIKDLQDQITALTPAEKSETELALEAKLAEVEARERRLNVVGTLTAQGIDKGMVDYLRDDADIEAFAKLVTSMVNQKITESGYQPSGHQSVETISPEKWGNMTYSEKSEFYNTNPELAQRLMARK